MSTMSAGEYMTQPFEVALIYLAGVVITVLVAFLTSKRQSIIELHKVLASFNAKLYEKRLLVYPDLYRIISALIKIIRFGPTSAIQYGRKGAGHRHPSQIRRG